MLAHLFPPAIALMALPLCAAARAAPAQADPAPVVFIDPGHGGLNEGSVGVGGLREKVMALDISLRLRALLQDRLGARVVMSRREDRFVGLRARTRQANRAGAHLFLSIHLNASPSPDPHGVAVYLLAAQSADREGMEAVRREEGDADPEERGGGEVGSILRGLRMAGAQRASAELGRQVHDALVSRTGARPRGIRQAPFAVLKEAMMPAVVVEVGFLTNPEEAKRLGDPRYRQRIAEGLQEAVARWWSRRSKR